MSTYIPIQSITLNASASTVEFTGIPQTFTDLVLVANILADNTTNRATRIRLNSDSGSNYSSTLLAGNGSSPESNRQSNSTFIPMTWFGAMVNSTTNPATCIININNYSNTTTNKTVLIRANRAEANTSGLVSLWRNPNAINTITLSLESNSFGSNSAFTLYGIAAGTAKAIGGEVTVTGGFAYHTFRQSGLFIPSENLTVDYLVVAGGGSGGVGFYGAGGGAGGVRHGSGLSVTANAFLPIIVGAGGASATTGSGNKGSDSVALSITSTGGGRGGAGAVAGGTGGSGGGGGGEGGGTAAAGGAGNTPSTSPSQGSNGGNGYAQSQQGSGGGGGGATANGGNGSQNLGGNGGNGYTWSPTGSTYGGGGGGAVWVDFPSTPGNGGTGGGTAGTRGGVASANATANTGGGSGGTGASAATGNGGSGVVIVRYAI